MLSVNKLEKILYTKGFLIKTIYSIGGECVYLYILNTHNSEEFLIYIPTKYKMSTKGRQSYSIKAVNIKSLDSPELLAENPGYLKEDIYREISVCDDIDFSKNNLTQQLEENYKQPLRLKDEKDTLREIRDITRQLDRFIYSLKSIKYKAGIQVKNYLCCIGRDNRLSSYIVKHYPAGDSARKLLIVVDLETFYNNIDTIGEKISNVKAGLYKIIDRNHEKHTANLATIIQNIDKIVNFSDNISVKKVNMLGYIQNLQSMLTRTCESEKGVIREIADLTVNMEEGGVKGLHSDISKSYQITKYNTQLDQITKTKEEITRHLATLQSKLDDMLLNCDSIYFDSILMLDKLIKNTDKLAAI